jgi:hypothetical protein
MPAFAPAVPHRPRHDYRAEVEFGRVGTSDARRRRQQGLVITSAVEETVMVRRITVAATLALTAVLLAGGGGGGNDRAKVEANLQHYLVSLPPDQNPFPMGAGTPRVKDNSCKDRHIRVATGHTMRSRTIYFRIGIGVALWTCVVKIGTAATPVNVLVDDRIEVAMAVPGEPLKVDKPNASRPSASWAPYPKGRQRLGG